MAQPADIKENTLWSATSFAAGTVTAAHQHDLMAHYSIWTNFSDAAPAAVSFTTAEITTTGNYIKFPAHSYKTGLPGNLTGTGAALPTGLSTATTYYVIERDADSFQLANSRANAVLGTAVVLATDNTISAFKPSALGTIDIHLEASIDGTNYSDVPGTTITAVGSTMTSVANIAYNYVRVECTVTAGQLTGTVKTRSIGRE